MADQRIPSHLSSVYPPVARLSATHIQKNVPFAGLVNAIDRAGYSCRFPNVLCGFLWRVIGGLSDNRSGAHEREECKQCFNLHEPGEIR
jgi:hypothetical protein